MLSKHFALTINKKNVVRKMCQSRTQVKNESVTIKAYCYQRISVNVFPTITTRQFFSVFPIETTCSGCFSLCRLWFVRRLSLLESNRSVKRTQQEFFQELRIAHIQQGSPIITSPNCSSFPITGPLYPLLNTATAYIWKWTSIKRCCFIPSYFSEASRIL